MVSCVGVDKPEQVPHVITFFFPAPSNLPPPLPVFNALARHLCTAVQVNPLRTGGPFGNNRVGNREWKRFCSGQTDKQLGRRCRPIAQSPSPRLHLFWV